MKALIAGLLILAALVAGAPASRSFTGVITDSMCARGDHSQMKMGANDAECTIACIYSHGAQYVLFDGKEAYVLSDQKTPEKFAGKKVTVVGSVNGKTIQVESIAAAK